MPVLLKLGRLREVGKQGRAFGRGMALFLPGVPRERPRVEENPLVVQATQDIQSIDDLFNSLYMTQEAL
jgi:hypothetical protein